MFFKGVKAFKNGKAIPKSKIGKYRNIDVVFYDGNGNKIRKNYKSLSKKKYEKFYNDVESTNLKEWELPFYIQFTDIKTEKVKHKTNKEFWESANFSNKTFRNRLYDCYEIEMSFSEINKSYDFIFEALESLRRDKMEVYYFGFKLFTSYSDNAEKSGVMESGNYFTKYISINNYNSELISNLIEQVKESINNPKNILASGTKDGGTIHHILLMIYGFPKNENFNITSYEKIDLTIEEKENVKNFMESYGKK